MSAAKVFAFVVRQVRGGNVYVRHDCLEDVGKCTLNVVSGNARQ